MELLVALVLMFPWSLVALVVVPRLLVRWSCPRCLGLRKIKLYDVSGLEFKHTRCERCRGWGYVFRRRGGG